MANIGDSLILPEVGWRRYDNKDKLINYSDGWGVSATNSSYGGNFTYTNKIGETASFYFYGNSIRFYTFLESVCSKSDEIIIDDTKYTFSSYGSTQKFCVLCLEVTGLEQKVHSVVIKSTSTKQMNFDAVDINDSGLLCEEDYVPPRVGLVFKKTLSKNVPDKIEEGLEEVHFTEKGEIFAYTNDGKKIKLGGSYGLNEMVLSSREW